MFNLVALPKKAESIVVRAPNWIGDQILAYPFFYHLRELYPNSRILSVCVPWVADLQFRNLVDEVFVLPKVENPSFFSRFVRVHQSAQDFHRRYGEMDLAMSLPNSFSAAWFLKQTRAKIRRGYSVEARGWLLNQAVKWDRSPNRHRAQAYLDLLGAGRWDARSFWKRRSFHPSESWPSAQPVDFSLERHSYFVLGPGATADSRRWPIERFIELSERISADTGRTPVIVGGPRESAVAEYVRTRIPGLVDLAGKGRVTEFGSVFKNAWLTITNESGLAHVASLCGSNVQIICGAADPRRTQPIGPGGVWVRANPVDCWPCERNVCYRQGSEHNQCLKGIHPENVWEEMKLEPEL